MIHVHREIVQHSLLAITTDREAQFFSFQNSKGRILPVGSKLHTLVSHDLG